ncbi:MAG: TonB-dependent receptor, partial [Bacteroidetes bacterium]|nr:TonB-dependent receptor [Bacteroidota bacterium]
DIYKINNKINVDGGIRIENTTHKGIKERWTTPTGKDPVINQFPLGQDGDYTTWYDAAFRKASGVYDTIDFNYLSKSGSLGLLYLLSDNQSMFLRYTYSNKTPELDYYVNNFENIKPQKGYIESINQLEFGYKLNKEFISCQAVAFLNHLENVPFQQFVYINNTTRMTPATFNTMQTMGLELECNISYFKHFQVQLNTTLLRPKLYRFTYYNMNLTPQNMNDDFEEDFSGNYISEIPRINSNLNIYYKYKTIKPYISLNYVGKRMGNMRNTIELPAYWSLGSGISFKLFKYFELSLFATNIFDSVGILSLGGLGSLNNGGTEMLTEQTLNNQKQNGQPIFARTTYPRVVGISFKFVH